MSLVLACIFGPSLSTDDDKKLLNSLLKAVFDFEPTNFIEELLTNLIKEQLNQFGYKHSPKQIQKMVDFYIGMRFSQSAIICGDPLDGKTTIWQILSKAINSLQSEELKTKSSNVFQKYSILINYFNEDKQFPLVLVHHLFPDVYSATEKPTHDDPGLLEKLVAQAERNFLSTYEIARDEAKSTHKQFEKWIVLDADMNDTVLLDQVAFLKGRSLSTHASSSRLPDTIKFVFEASSLSNVSPAIVTKALLVVQRGLEWRSVLETKVNEVCVKYSVPQKKIALVHEMSGRLFGEWEAGVEALGFRSVLHGDVALARVSLCNFVFGYVNMVDCLLRRFVEELKRFDEGSVLTVLIYTFIRRSLIAKLITKIQLIYSRNWLVFFIAVFLL